MKESKLIVFDLDGTLIDSVPALASATNQMLQRLGRDAVSHDSIRNWVGNGADVLVGRALSNHINVDPNLDPELCAHARRLFDDFYEEITQDKTQDPTKDLYPNVASTLHALAADYSLALLTNKPSQFLPDILSALGFEDLFDHVIGGDTFPEKKPNPMGLNWLCEQYQLSPQQVVMVGDSKHDIATGKAAGTHTFALTYGYNHGEPIANSNPDFVADDIAEITSWLINK